MKSAQGQFAWYDLVTTDTEAAVEFYTHVIGWGTQMWNGPQPYTMFENEGTPLGGVVNAGQGMGDAPPHWLAYVTVDDVDATAKKVTELGGKILGGPNDIPGSGRYAVIADPQGAHIAIYQSSAPSTGMAVTLGRGQFSWHELTTTDHKAAFDFYSKIFGWEMQETHDMGAMGIYQIYGMGDTQFGGMLSIMPNMPVSPNWLCYILIDSVVKSIERAKSKGAELLMGPYQVPGGEWIAHLRDPQGGVFALQSPKT